MKLTDDQIDLVIAENEALQIYKHLADEYGLSVFDDIATLKLDAERYRQVRRGQHWSVVDGIGDTLRAELLDQAIDAMKESK